MKTISESHGKVLGELFLSHLKLRNQPDPPDPIECQNFRAHVLTRPLNGSVERKLHFDSFLQCFQLSWACTVEVINDPPY